MVDKRLRTTAIAGLLGLSMIGCGKKMASDQGIATDIEAKLYNDPVTKPAPIKVAVDQGTVTLTGTVPNHDAELEAMKIANASEGVRTVQDKLSVDGSLAATGATPTQPVADGSTPAPAPVAASAPPPPMQTAPAPVPVVVPAGERVIVRTIDAVDSSTAAPGQAFRGSLDAPLTSHGRVVIPAREPVTLEVTAARGAGRIKGNSELQIRLASISYHGRPYRVDSSVYEDQGKGRGKQTAVRTGVGAGVGALIGAIAGGGKGAAIGSAVGGGAGFGSAALTHGQQIKIPSETVLTFRLEAPLTVE